MKTTMLFAALMLACARFPARAADADRDPAWTEAYKKGPMTADETREFIKSLTKYVFDNHMKKTEGSAQRGMIYEYFHVPHKGQHDQFIQGEALDTMHDGAWFAIAMINAYRATGDSFYKELVTKWQLPFYLKMLNHSDELFTSDPNDGRPGDDRGWKVSKEWLLQGREKGFVPYWWDDGASISLDMLNRKDKDTNINFAGHNDLKDKPNEKWLLSGYSHGSSNHMAQDLALLLLQSWVLLHDSSDPAEQKLAAEVAEAAKNLQECRVRHGAAGIPAVRAALALASGDAAIRASLPDDSWKSVATARNDWRRCLFEFTKDQSVSMPGFADDQEYTYYVSIARNGVLTPPAAFHVAYDALTLPKLYAIYSDDVPTPPGINVFDLHPYKFVNGKPADARSERKGPGGKPRPIGSRCGPQMMVAAGWALQALKANPGLWATAREQIKTPNFFPPETDDAVRTELEKQLGGGLRTWEAVFKSMGYIPTGMGVGNRGSILNWDELSDAGGYAHLISAASQWLMYLEGKSDWDLQRLPKLAK
jgi:hypothetical protein